MGECLKTVVKIVLAVLPVICIVLLSVSIVMLGVSLDPGVKWNEYTQPVYGIDTYYFSTLFSSLDVAIYAGTKNNLPCVSKYLPVLNPHHDESWKVPIQNKLYQALGLVSGTLFMLMLSLTIHSVSKQKLFTVITKVIALGTGVAGGYFILNATGEYVKGLPGAISLSAASDYYVEKEDMQIGHHLAKYSAVITIIGCALIFANIALFIPLGEGKWIWQKKTDVMSDTEKTIPEKFTNPTETNKTVQPVKNKRDIVTVKEFLPE
ncbi:Hypothetical predicted protein [Mytilus galloprovincialis]|uniref:Uncharacterized protein n=1 Tax=Mytilus galloprovincialis TaxID=29158 RepID=A0A8B6CWF9_MYTGA|nr:Hypothetical predicted protein [Mytilus galloprovincialis]